MDPGHDEAGIGLEQAPEAVEAVGLGQVIRLPAELALGLGDDVLDVEFPGQDARHVEEHGEVVHVAVDALRDARVLDLQGQIPAVGRPRPVNLADRGGGHGLEIEGREAGFPALAVLAAEKPAHLGDGHHVRRGPQHGQGLRELGRQHVLGVHGHELAELHRRATQVGEVLRQPLRVPARQEGACAGRRRPAERLPEFPGDPSGRQLARGHAHAQQSPGPGRRHPRLASRRFLAQLGLPAARGPARSSGGRGA